MVRSAPLGFRIEPELKAALEKAAEDDGRSVSSFVERVLIAHLRDKGYLPKAAV
jgi:hypothetical protein